jgi:hypothetical protein
LYKDEQLTQKKNADTEIDVTHPVFLSGVKGGGCVDQSLSKSTRLLTLFHLPERVGLGSQPALLNLAAQPTNAPSITFHFDLFTLSPFIANTHAKREGDGKAITTQRQP